MNLKKTLSPFQKYVKTESLSGIFLLTATVVALIWANSPWAESYQNLWQHEIGFTSEIFTLNKPLILWINDGLMSVFFFLIGLEIKREFLIGELNSTKKLAFPLFGAIGGMVFPILFFVLFNKNAETAHGWGIPMATDIAFALAVLKLLGNRVPLSLKVFLTAFAIVDDLGAVLVIALFYSENIEFMLLFMACGILALLYILSYKGYYSKLFTITMGAIVWILFLKSGVHPTLSGILLAFSIPTYQKIATGPFIEQLESITQNIKNATILKEPILSKQQIKHIDMLEDWIHKYQSPLQWLENKLHHWVAFVIIPLFALANAGVQFNSSHDLDQALIITLILSLILGNSIGISSVVFVAKKLKITQVPKGINNRHIIGVSFLAGIGFTMAIFIASLAYKNDPAYVDSAKIGILIGSVISATIGYFILRFNPSSKKIKS